MDKKIIKPRFDDYDAYGHISSAGAVHLSIQERFYDFYDEILKSEKEGFKFAAKTINVDFKKECKMFFEVFKSVRIENLSAFSFSIIYDFLSSEGAIFFSVNTKMCFISPEGKLTKIPQYFLERLNNVNSF